jgi:hypothetical protein
MTGPSAIGLENGMPTSMMLAPARSSAGRIFSVVSKSGNPTGMNGMNAICRFARSSRKVSAIDLRAAAAVVAMRCGR